MNINQLACSFSCIFIFALQYFNHTTIYAHSDYNENNLSERFIIQKLQNLIEATVRQNKILVDSAYNELWNKTSRATAYATALIFVFNTLECPAHSGLIDILLYSLKFFLATSVSGYCLHQCYAPIILYLGGLASHNTIKCSFTNINETYHSALINFIMHWLEFKQKTPPLLWPQFDALYLEYLNNGATLPFHTTNAKTIIDNLLTECIKQDSHSLLEKANLSHDTTI